METKFLVAVLHRNNWISCEISIFWGNAQEFCIRNISIITKFLNYQYRRKYLINRDRVGECNKLTIVSIWCDTHKPTGKPLAEWETSYVQPSRCSLKKAQNIFFLEGPYLKGINLGNFHLSNRVWEI